MSRYFDVAVVGCGPAGMAAAAEAARWGARTAILDENHRAGGQLFKQLHKFFGSKEHYAGTRGFQIAEQLLRECLDRGVEVLLDCVVYGIENGNNLAVVWRGASRIINAARIVLASGASENSIPFPGWTLPGVMGAGALQTIMNIERVVPGKRLLMVGSGNVGLIVAFQALQAGLEVAALVDIAPRIGGYGVHAAKLARCGVPIHTGSRIVRALGEEYVRAGEVDLQGKSAVLEVDIICLSVGLRPATELARIVGCSCEYREGTGYGVSHSPDMETSVSTIYAAGDVTGIEEASTALEEGRLAGLAATESLGLASGEEALRRKSEIRARLSELRAEAETQRCRDS